MAQLTREDFLDAGQRKVLKGEINGNTYYVKEMNGADAAPFLNMFVAGGLEFSGDQLSEICLKSLCDENGERLFKNSEMSVFLKNVPSSWVMHIASTALSALGITDEESDAIAKN